MFTKKDYLFVSALLISLATQLPNQAEECKNAITYKATGGRFGDQLLNYVRCKYFAYIYHLPFLYRPFQYSDQLKMHTEEKNINSIRIEKKFTYTWSITNYLPSTKVKGAVLYSSDFYTETPDNLMRFVLETRQLRDDLRKKIAPIKPIHFSLPSDRITVAVHVRRGGGFDRPRLSGTTPPAGTNRDSYIDVIHPRKFPPDSFYIQALSHISQLLNNQPLYVYIFTDDKNPELIASAYEKAIGKKNILFDFYRTTEHFDSHLIYDLFFMKEFDYLIRPKSSFSIIAQMIGAHKLVISPREYHWEENKLIIDKAKLTTCSNDTVTEKIISLS